MEITEEKMSDETQRHRRLINLNRRRRRRRKLAAAPNVHIHIGPSVAMGKMLTPTPSGHSVMKYVVPSLLALVALKYQGKTESLFVERPAPLWCFLVAIVLYWVIVGIMEQISTLDTILSRAALASGLLSVLSLVSILLQKRISLVPLITWAPLPVVLAWPIFYSAYIWLRSRIASVFIRGRSLQRETCLPV